MIKSHGNNIGILGGTFDPAHYGHVEISKFAHQSIGLKQIWWIISSQNPMKDQSLHSFAERIAKAEEITKKIPYIEIYKETLNLKTNYTSELIEKINNKNLGVNFIWIMGADNLVSFHKWHKFQNIIENIPIAVIDRGKYKNKALKSKTAIRYCSNFIHNRDMRTLPFLKPPAWTYLNIKTLDISSTEIRKNDK